jgi:hypothetical protein
MTSLIPTNDELKLAEDVAHAQIGQILFGLRETVNDLIAIRVREFGPLLENEEGELFAIKNSLDWLLSDIRESRIVQSRKLRVISNGQAV